MSENNNELKRNLEQVTGPRFCRVLGRAQLDQMNKFIEEYESGDVIGATRTLQSLDFLVNVVNKTCKE